MADKTDNSRDPAPSANARKREDRGLLVQSKIMEVKMCGGITELELNNMDISTIPEDLMDVTSLQYLYLAGNRLSSLPENFFDCLPNLIWLDLRRNYLASVPSAYVGSHKCLCNLLLEGNQLRTLPLELGLVSTLSGLNIANNPLEFPPQDIIMKGTQSILEFFRELLRAKSQGRVLKVPKGVTSIDDTDSDSDSEKGSPRRAIGHSRLASGNKIRSGIDRGISQDTTGSIGSSLGDFPELVGPVPQSASLHKPSSYNEMRHLQMTRLKKAALQKHSATKKQRVHQIVATKSVGAEQPPPQELIEHKYLEERKMARLRELKEKQNMLLQRRKDHELLKSFRDDSRQLQHRKQREKMMKGGQLDYDIAAENAPFDVSEEHMRIATNEERIAADIRDRHEEMRRAMSPASLLKVEENRRERDRELEKRIRDHTQSMQERKRKPKGNPQEEMHAAMEELRIAEQLQLEIAARRKDLEYRFTAFTGDLPPHSTNQKRIKVKPPLAPITPGR